MLTSTVWSIALSVVQLLLSLSLATATVYLGVRIFDTSNKKIDEIKEIKKGNVAVAILMAAVIFSLASIIQVGVENLTALVNPLQSVNLMMAGVLFGVFQLLIGLAVAIFAIRLSLAVFDKLAPELGYMAQLKKNNVAVAILLAGVILAVSTIIRAGVSGLVSAVDPAFLATLF